MANEYRFPMDYRFGTLTTAAAIADTSLSSAEFAPLVGGTLSTILYVPIVLHDPSVPAYEIVWATAHVAAATTVTVVRGKEASTARAWPSGTQWIIAPTVRDALYLAYSTATLPTDANVGSRAVQTDTGDVWSKTKNQGWQSWAATRPVDMATSGTPVPNGYKPVFKAAGYPSTNTDGAGHITFTFPGGGFSTAIIGAVGQTVYGTAGAIKSWQLDNLTLTTCMFTYYSDASVLQTGLPVVMHVIAFGY